jgi:undecaprenyl-diphosphatase
LEAVTKVGDLSVPGGTGIVATAIATLIAFVVGYAVIVWFLKIITTRSYMPFVIYRLAFAAVIVVLVATGTIAAN